MEHLPQEDLVQFTAGELQGPRRAEVEQHLNECPVCRALYERQAAVWEALGRWTPEAAPQGLLANVQRKLAERIERPPAFWPSVGRIFRIAAAIAIGVGVGYGAARTLPPTKSGPPQISFVAAEEAAVESLGLQHFENPSPAGFYAALPEAPRETTHEEEQS
jgi:anti-sigma factor RsiW